MLDSEVMRRQSRLVMGRNPIVIETALIRVNAPSVAEIVEISNDFLAGGNAQQIDFVITKSSVEKCVMKASEVRIGECARLAATLPCRLVQSS